MVFYKIEEQYSLVFAQCLQTFSDCFLYLRETSIFAFMSFYWHLVFLHLTELIDFKVDWLGCQFLAVVLASQSEVVYICTLSALYYMAKQHRRSRAEILAWALTLQ